MLAIAARPNGSVVAAGSSLLTAVSAEGNKLWETDIHTRHAIGSNESQRHPTLAVDAAGTAFVGVVDGEVAVIDSAGNAISRLDAGGYLYGDTPGVMIGPDRSLLVSGTDGVLRAYQ